MFNNLSTKLKVRSSRFAREHSSGLAKTIFILIVTAICFIPLYIALFFWWMVSPSGFWPVFATSALLLVVFGSTQAICLFIGVIVIINVLIEDL